MEAGINSANHPSLTSFKGGWSNAVNTLRIKDYYFFFKTNAKITKPIIIEIPIIKLAKSRL